MPNAWHFGDIATGWMLLSQGLLYTLTLSALSFSVSLILATVLGFLRGEGPRLRSNLAWLSRLITIYVEVIRGLPLILLLVFIHYAVMPLLGIPGNFFLSALLTFILFETAYLSEIIRSGLNSVTQAERDSAIALGLNPLQQMRHVILPLAMTRMTPALLNQLVTLVKDTSLASIVGVVELTRAGEIIYQQTYHDFEIILFQATVYFVLCFSLSRLSERFEYRDPRTA